MPGHVLAENGTGDRKSDDICRTTHAMFEGMRESVNDLLETSS